MLSELVEREALVRYVPPWLGDSVPTSATSPLLAQRLLTKVLLYDGRAFGDRSPVDNLWELTEPQWRGRVAMVDPLERGDYLDLLTEVALRTDEMEAAYRARYRRAPQLGDARNAGERWILDLLANDPRRRARGGGRDRPGERADRARRPRPRARRLLLLFRRAATTPTPAATCAWRRASRLRRASPTRR